MTKGLPALIDELITYGLDNRLIAPADRVLCINRLLEVFGEDEYEPSGVSSYRSVSEILTDLTDIAVSKGLTEDTTERRDLFDTKLMGLITPMPSVVIEAFEKDRAVSPKQATDKYYAFSKATNYIRCDRIAKDEKWITPSEYGDIEITINLSKPEKDPRDIAKAGTVKSSSYPKCLLCAENEGYAGHIGHPARQNHRIIPLSLAGEQYYLQYSPYVYYNEHCIVFNEKHIPMVINRGTFEKLLDFTEQFPHYTVGSNADLPIVGGSILSHDHFQGGAYSFPMAKAQVERSFELPAYKGLKAGIVKWPMSVIRLTGEDKEQIINASEFILDKWRKYTDEEAYIFAETDGVPHNTITPIARRRGEEYEMDLVLRNNITTDECPMGLYHPHNEYHHIKKENIGLIEVQGLAILPARLKTELKDLKEAMLEGKDIRSIETIAKHADWVEEWKGKLKGHEGDEAFLDKLIRDEVGHYFVRILACAGVYKRDEKGAEAFMRFIESLGKDC